MPITKIINGVEKELANKIKIVNGQEKECSRIVKIINGQEKEIWSNSIGRLIDLGVGTSFNVKNTLPNDYQSLNANNFYIYQANGSIGGGGSTDEYTHNQASSSGTLVKSYNASTGVLTCYNSMYEDHRDGSGSHSSTGTGSCGVKVFVPNPKLKIGNKVMKLISLGSGQSFDVKEFVSGWAKLTANDFYAVSYSQIGVSQHGGTSSYVYTQTTLQLDKSYNNTTGILTLRIKNTWNSTYANANVYLIRNK